MGKFSKNYTETEIRQIMKLSEIALSRLVLNPSPEDYRRIHGISHIQARCTAILITNYRISELDEEIAKLERQRLKYKNDLAGYQKDLTELLNFIGPLKEEN